MRNQIENYLHFAKVLVDLRSERIGEFGIIVVMEIEREGSLSIFAIQNGKSENFYGYGFAIQCDCCFDGLGSRWGRDGRGLEEERRKRERKERERESEGEGQFMKKMFKIIIRSYI